MDLIIIPTLKEENVFCRQNSSNVVMCCMDIEVMLCSCEAYCSFCLMMEIVGCTGADMKRAFTSYYEMHYPCSN